MDIADRNVKQQIGVGVLRAYGPPGYVTRADEPDPYDPELCDRCQRVRPANGDTVCETCRSES